MVVDYKQTINRFTVLDAYPLPDTEEMVREISQYSWFSTFDLKSAYHQVPICEEEQLLKQMGAFMNLLGSLSESRMGFQSFRE